MITHFRTALILLAAFTLLTGVVYPAMVTGIAQVFFPHQANGSLIVIDGAVAGSELIGQPFDAPWYFWGRPSATEPFPYNAAASAGSNLGPLNPALERAVRLRMEALRRAGSQSAALQDAGMENVSLVPVDLVTASASGLDPHISVAAARYQIPRVARARGVAEAGIAALVEQHTQSRQLGFLGEPRVNVLALNLALDAAYPLISWDKIR